MTQQEQEDLADHIRDFLIGHSHIITDHVDNFDTGIHFTTNFLPWHRVPVRELEDYIQTLLNQEDQWLA